MRLFLAAVLALAAFGFGMVCGGLLSIHRDEKAAIASSAQCIVRSMEVQDRCSKSFSELKAQIDRLR